jgi:hypothetical protein
MKRIVLLSLLMGMAGAEEHHQHPAPPPNPVFDKLKTLAGSWEGTMKDYGKEMPATTMFKMVSGGSVLMNILAEGKPHEMVTMFHLDGKEVVATHYCAAMNQPRFKAVPGAINQVVFEFTDGTNIAANDGHMQKIIFTFDGPDHHVEEWVYRDKGKDSTGTFDFKRKK